MAGWPLLLHGPAQANKHSGVGETSEDALVQFKRYWGERGPITIIEAPPEPPRREGERAAPIEAALGQAEHLRRGHEVYKRLLHEFHPDKHAGETYSAGEITAALIQLWEAVR